MSHIRVCRKKNFSMNHSACFFVSLLLLVPAAHADDDSRPSTFYEHEFARSPLDAIEVPNAGAKSKKSPAGSSIKKLPHLKSGKSHSSSESLDKTKASTDVKSGMLAGFETQPVLSVGLIVNAFDEQHMVAELETLAELLESRQLYGGHIYLMHVGELAAAGDALLKLSVFGADTHFISSLPEKYKQIERSPTWIVRTEKGEYLLEGVENLANFITTDGGFVEEPIAAPAMEEAEPTPVPLKPEGF